MVALQKDMVNFYGLQYNMSWCILMVCGSIDDLYSDMEQNVEIYKHLIQVSYFHIHEIKSTEHVIKKCLNPAKCDTT
jgi:hypothetical protein